MAENKRSKADPPSARFIKSICDLYGDVYDDREENSKPGGEDWIPGVAANHLSLAVFQKRLEESYGIKLSRTKLQKILITGGCWTTERSREVAKLYEQYTRNQQNGGAGLSKKVAVQRIAAELEISTVSVNINLPYEKTVYDLEDKSSNAKRIVRWRGKRK